MRGQRRQGVGWSGRAHLVDDKLDRRVTAAHGRAAQAIRGGRAPAGSSDSSLLAPHPLGQPAPPRSTVLASVELHTTRTPLSACPPTAPGRPTSALSCVRSQPPPPPPAFASVDGAQVARPADWTVDLRVLVRCLTHGRVAVACARPLSPPAPSLRRAPTFSVPCRERPASKDAQTLQAVQVYIGCLGTAPQDSGLTPQLRRRTGRGSSSPVSSAHGPQAVPLTSASPAP